MIYIGIDPGQTGGICSVRDGNITMVEYMPTMARLHGKGHQVDGYELSSMLMEMRDGQPCQVVVEAVNSSPGMGVRSAFNFGEGNGIILGCLATLGMQYRLVTPSRWKRIAGLTGRGKDASRAMAKQLFPDHSDEFRLKKSDGKAEAAVLAHLLESKKI